MRLPKWLFLQIFSPLYCIHVSLIVYVKDLSSLEFLFIVLLTFNQSKNDAFIIVDISNAVIEDDFDLNAMPEESGAAMLRW